MRRAVAAHRNLTMTMGRIIEAHPLVTTWDTAEELNVSNSIVIQQLKQAGKVKELDKWVSHELTHPLKKHVVLKCCLNSMQQRAVSWSDCDMWWKVGSIDNWRKPAQGLDQQETPKHFPKPNLHQKKITVTVWWSAAGLIHYSCCESWQNLLGSSVLSKSMRCGQNCNDCSSWHWPTDWVQFFSMTIPYLSAS